MVLELKDFHAEKFIKVNFIKASLMDTANTFGLMAATIKVISKTV